MKEDCTELLRAICWRVVVAWFGWNILDTISLLILIKGGWDIVNGCLIAAEQIKSIRFACRLIWDGEEYWPRNCIENLIRTSIVQVC